jgi:hypothetical protein
VHDAVDVAKRDAVAEGEHVAQRRLLAQQLEVVAVDRLLPA